MRNEKNPNGEGRRNYLKMLGGLAGGLIVGGAAGWLAKPQVEVPGPTETVTVPGATVTVPGATVTVTPTAAAPWWDAYMPRADRDLAPKYPWIMDYMGVKEGEYLYEDDWARSKVDWDSLKDKFKGKELNVTWEGSAIDIPEFFKPKFEALTGCKVNVISIPYTILHEKIMADLVSGAGAYDIMAFYVGWGASYLPYLYDLREFFEKYELDLNEYHPFVRPHITGPNGEMLGLVTDADMWCFSARMNLLERVGIDIVPDTWEDVLYAIDSLKPIADKEGWYPFDAIYNAKGFCCYLSWNEIAFQWEDYKVLKDPSAWEPDFKGRNGGGVEALKVYKKLIEASPPGAITYEYPEGREQWLSGRAAMEVGWTCLPHLAMYPEFSKISPINTDNRIGIGPVPKATARRACGIWVTTAGGIEKASKNPELAFLFTLLMTSQESMTMGMLQGSENHVGFKEVLRDPRVTDVSPGLKNTWVWGWTAWTTPFAFIPEHYEIGEAIGSEIHRYLDGSVPDAETAIENAEKAAREKLQRGGYLDPGASPPPPYNLRDWCKTYGVALPQPWIR